MNLLSACVHGVILNKLNNAMLKMMLLAGDMHIFWFSEIHSSRQGLYNFRI